MTNTSVPTAQGAQLTWTAPGKWPTAPGSPMRKGSYRVPGSGGRDGDLSITAFPGDVGGELANVNRWRGQAQLPPVDASSLADVVTRVRHNGLDFAVIDASGGGRSARRILGAIVPFGGSTWFFKLSGPAALVGGAKPAFLAFLQTVKPASPRAR